ncbi:hypothetical protein G6011_02971 [Alternaria panax]|uniref:Uncharacterized protein n=1 Tax=Alternaria panax TaxID=48097 RepID=A0AAD4FAM6_9PLEO|nr:hypothetical protein G6011_02971 [Alternaria panax]
MKLHLLPIFVLAALAPAHILPPPNPLTNLTHDANLHDSISSNATTSSSSILALHPRANPPTKYEKAIDIGRTLISAMKSKDRVARWFFKDFPQYAETCQSPYKGDGKAELATWGYDDSAALSKTVEKECDFDVYHKIKEVFDDLGLDTRGSKDGGPNHCFKINHQDGPAIKRNEDGSLPSESKQFYDVCGKTYQATGATFEFAANPSGLVALMNIMSLSYTAKTFTWHRTPLPSELPHFGTAQDIAWAVWNRVNAPDLAGLKYLLVTQIMNAGSRELFRSALGGLDPPQSEVKVWPGHEFRLDTDGGRAILGSPVGRWAGYLLLQHKDELKGNRYIDKVRLFKPPGASLPYLLFYVAKDSSVGGEEPLGVFVVKDEKKKVIEQRVSMAVAGRSRELKSLVREHKVFVRV